VRERTIFPLLSLSLSFSFFNKMRANQKEEKQKKIKEGRFLF
jgi:hypothetical protein